MSEIVEPIVVTPGKELETPEFFKKDIEKIAQGVAGEVSNKKLQEIINREGRYLVKVHSVAIFTRGDDEAAYGFIFSSMQFNSTSNILEDGEIIAYDLIKEIADEFPSLIVFDATNERTSLLQSKVTPTAIEFNDYASGDRFVYDFIDIAAVELIDLLTGDVYNLDI